jgi:hypothetical protein
VGQAILSANIKILVSVALRLQKVVTNVRRNDCLSKAHHPYTAENQILFDESPKCSMTNFDWSGVSRRAAVVLLF